MTGEYKVNSTERRPWLRMAFYALALLSASPLSYSATVHSDAAIRKEIIKQSVAAYPGVCACPYSTMRNGRRCGRRSAYSRPGGYAPLCYPDDVTDRMVQRYRRTHVASRHGKKK